MDANLKAQWLAALRSGQYQQGEGSLRTQDDKYCCLGVLCDIVNPNGWDDQSHCWTVPENIGGDDYLSATSGHLLPEALAITVIGENSHGSINQDVTLDFQNYNSSMASLVDLNDSGLTFSQIADVIENKL